MRVGLVGVGWAPDQAGGLNRYLRGLHDGLQQTGQDPVPAVLGPAPSAPPHVEVVSDARASLPARLLALRRAVVRLAPSLDVLDGHFALTSALPLEVPAVRALPLVVHFHGPWAAESRATGAGRVAVALKRAAERRVYLRADRLVVLSDAFRQELLGYGVPPERIRQVRPGAELDRFVPVDAAARSRARARLGVREDAWLLVAVRRLVPRMGLAVLLRALGELVAADPGSPAQLLVVGEGPERPVLEQLADELGLTGRVVFTGRLDDELLPLAYACADLAVTPSLALEGFGLVLLEALATGTPVLASDIGGMREALAGLPSGHLVPPGEVAAWRSALEQASRGRRDLADRARCRQYAEGFTWTATAEQVTEVYREAVAARAGAGQRAAP